MCKIFVLIFSTFGILSATAQSGNHNRCEITRKEDMDQFEHWLFSKPVNADAKTSKTYRIPVVVHVLHIGEPIGEGFNYSTERIESQIRTLNEDFRRKVGSPGFNAHPDGEDTKIEFVLAQIGPDGNPTNGIVRVDRTLGQPPTSSDLITVCSKYSYWDPEEFLNIWCMDVGLHGIYSGKSSFPTSDLDGLPKLSEDSQGDGIFINAINFGQGGDNTVANLDMGRTLTHEMGHFLGLLHTFGPPGDCSYSDYCVDTPPISSATNGCPSEKPLACDGRPAMIENYMDYSYDRCMNIFTKDQTARMRFVLENSPRRKSLLTSPVIERSDEDVTGIPDDSAAIKIFPNPAADNLHISVSKKFRGADINVTAYNLLGKIAFKKTYRLAESEIEIPVSEVSEKCVILVVDGSGLCLKQLVVIN